MGLQISALEGAGCSIIFRDHGVSGAKTKRPGLEAAFKELRHGDALVVWRLDRLGRSLIHLVQVINELAEHGIEFRSLSESIDTASSGGRLVFHIMAALAEFERSLISERTRAGMEAAKKKGQHVGRPKALSPSQLVEARNALKSGEAPSSVAARLQVHVRTLKRSLAG